MGISWVAIVLAGELKTGIVTSHELRCAKLAGGGLKLGDI